MRFYAIEILDPDESRVRRRWTSFPNARVDPNALDMELDVGVTFFATPFIGAYVRIYGIDVRTIAQASNFNGLPIALYVGMQKGLPLARPEQSGLVARGIIQQAFGNWIGTNMTLDLVFTAGNVLPSQVINGSFLWRAGTPMADIIRSTLTTLFPTYAAPRIDISPRLKLSHDQPGYYGTMGQLSTYFRDISKSIINDPTGQYPGVGILLKDRQFIVSDGTVRAAPKAIKYTDLIGQVTWLSSAQVSITTVMRADIIPTDLVTLPPGQATTTQQSFSQARLKDTFEGVFRINNARHVGRFRQSGGESWITVFNASYEGRRLSA